MRKLIAISKVFVRFVQRLLWILAAWLIVVCSLVFAIVVEVIVAIVAIITLPVVMVMDLVYKTPWEVLDVYKTKRSEEIRK